MYEVKTVVVSEFRSSEAESLTGVNVVAKVRNKTKRREMHGSFRDRDVSYAVKKKELEFRIAEALGDARP